MALIQKYFPL